MFTNVIAEKSKEYVILYVMFYTYQCFPTIFVSQIPLYLTTLIFLSYTLDVTLTLSDKAK